MDIYRALIGDPPTEEEKLQAVAKMLRARSNLGMVGQMTGDRVISPVGQQMVTEANTQAQQLGVRGETARYRRYQEGASQRSAELNTREQAWREADAEAQRRHEIQLELLRQKGDLSLQGAKGTSKKYRPMTVKQVDDLTSQYQDYRQLSEIADNFKDSYAGTAFPGQRPLANTLASYGKGTKNSKDAAKWWADYNNLYTLPTRNKLFGATLTENERVEWEKNAISPNMTATQIKERIAYYRRKVSEKSTLIPRNLKAAGYDPEAIDTIFSDPAEIAAASEDGVIVLE
jgi:hypothetical protein